jgi:hypothetical protein
LSYRMRAAIITIWTSTSVGACAQSGRSDAPQTAPDSIVLERTLCYGTCPAYRLSLTRHGIVSFESRNPGDTARRGRDTVSAGTFALLAATADSLSFASLPDTVANSRALCPDKATDHPTATVTIFRGAQTKHVVDYRGCFAASDHTPVPVVGRLRRFEARIDSLAGSRRWVQPARRR